VVEHTKKLRTSRETSLPKGFEMVCVQHRKTCLCTSSAWLRARPAQVCGAVHYSRILSKVQKE